MRKYYEALPTDKDSHLIAAETTGSQRFVQHQVSSRSHHHDNIFYSSLKNTQSTQLKNMYVIGRAQIMKPYQPEMIHVLLLQKPLEAKDLSSIKSAQGHTTMTTYFTLKKLHLSSK